MDELFNTPEMYYNAQYFLHLMCPGDMIPNFSDSNWRSNWVRYLVFFEAVAKAYHDPHLKRAAATIAQKFIDFDQFQNTGLAIEIQHGKKQVIIGAKRDLRMDMARDWRRPKYTYESGRIKYGDLETNGDFLFAIKDGKKLAYTGVNLAKIKYKDKWLLNPKPALFGLAFDENIGIDNITFHR